MAHSRSRQVAAGLTAAFLAAPAVGASLPASAAPQIRDTSTQTYIVQLADAPVASYDGTVAGFAATKPAEGAKVEARSAAAQKWAKHLKDKQVSSLREVGADANRQVRSYSLTFNGYAANLTAAEALRLQRVDGVVRVWKDEIRHADTTTTRDYLGMTGPNGVWQKRFGGTADAGKGVIVGVIDSGINSHHPSFDDMPGRTIPSTWKGVCDKGADKTFRCNNKIIGARYYGADKGNRVNPETEIAAPTDYNGHGSHTASTAAGNGGVKASMMGYDLGEISGMAPAAQIAVYKALWATPDGRASGSSAGLVQAIEDAVSDGVDIINYSVSGSSNSISTPEELAFMGAADAGVFISASAGNSGDSGPSTVAHNAPWTMTVAASTHDRGLDVKSVTLGNGKTYEGVGLGAAVATAPLVHASQVGLPGVDATKLAQCFSDPEVADKNPVDNGIQPFLDPAKVKGKIVVCDRGGNARVDKSAAVKNAGGVGMVQVNTTAEQTLNADFHAVPSVHLDNVKGAEVKAYSLTEGATASLAASKPGPKANAPMMASFSSYGPALAGQGDMLKPDITAPGVDIIAAMKADGDNAKTFESMQGTSMSAPHIAGLAALMRQKYRTWSPAALKSAMMTTATTVTNEGKPIERQASDPSQPATLATPLNYGAGHVQPDKAYTPGLVYDSGIKDWKQYACSLGQLQTALGEEACANVKKIDPSDMNYPSIAVGDLPGRQTITRTVTNVESKATRYTASVTAPKGFKVSVWPSSMTVQPGRKATFKVTIERTTAPLGEYAFGSLTWKGNRGQQVTSPIAVRPVAVTLPALHQAEAKNGMSSFDIRTGFNGPITLDVNGLVAGVEQKVEAVRDEKSAEDGVLSIDVPAGTELLRLSTDQATAGVEDLDMQLLNPKGEVVLTSAAEGSNEWVMVPKPEPGVWKLRIDLYSPEPKATIPVTSWLVADKNEHNMLAIPRPPRAFLGQTARITLVYQGLRTGKLYLGSIGIADDRTVVMVKG